MARHNSRGRRKSGPPFVQLFTHLLKSEAWQSLKPAARAIYIAITQRYDGTNNGYLAASVRDLASECHADKNTVMASLNVLIERGLIERTQASSFSCKVRLAPEYRLTCHYCDRSGQKASHAFRAWCKGGGGGADDDHDEAA